jgi:hypothetical protein
MRSEGARRFRFAGLFLVVALMTKGCTLSLLYLSSIVEEGGIVTVVLAGDPDGQAGGASSQRLVARVPSGWTLQSGTFAGTSNGSRIAGAGTGLPADCTCLCNPPAGYQDIEIEPQAGVFSFVGTDDVTMTLRFTAAGQGSQPVSFKLCLNNSSNTVEATVSVLPPGSGLLFADDFESAGTSSWAQSLALSNGGFELADESWISTSMMGVDAILGPGEAPIPPFAGDWTGRLGGVDSEVTSLSPAEFLLPVTPYRLVFRKWLDSSEPTCNSNDWFSIWVNNAQPGEEALCVASSTGGWVEGSLDLGAWAGQPVVVYFSGYTDEDDPSAVYLDEIELRNFGN